MRLLVTGGCGFIGSNLVHHLLHAAGEGDASCCPDEARYPDSVDGDLRILNLDKLTYAADPSHLDGVSDHGGYRFEQVDIRDADAVDDAVAGFEPDAIVHLAAESHVDRSIEDGTVFAETNVVGTQVLLDAARRHDVDRFVHVGTDEVYGSIQEGSFDEDAGLDPSSPYSASKAGSDLLVHAHHETYGLEAVVTRCTNNYGPRQHPEKLLPKMITLAADGEDLPIYGDGMNVRDWLYVKDHCTALWTVLREGQSGEVYNVAGGNEVPNLELVKTVLGRMDAPTDLITFVDDRPGHDYRYSLDDTKLRDLGWRPRTSLDEGLDDTIAWYLDRETSP